MNKLNARQLREVEEEKANSYLTSLKRRPIYLILENVYDTYNVGGLFRLADALAVEKIYLCGEMEIPPNPKIKKASIGTYKVVPWEYKKTAREAIEELRTFYSKTNSMSFRAVSVGVEESLKRDPSTAVGMTKSSLVSQKKNKKVQIVAIEQSEKAVEYTKANYSLPVAFVVGNETTGVLPETLDLVDQIVEIPMWGINKSLNVIVSAAIVTYWAVSEPEAGIEPAL